MFDSVTGQSVNDSGNLPLGEPWPYLYWQQPPAYTPAPCDHCLCIDLDPDDSRMMTRTRPHRECCHCRKVYAFEEAHADPD